LLKVNGSVEIPYISDENADEDPDLRVTVEDEGPIGKRIKDAMFSKGKGLILEKVRVWVQSMARGGPVKEELDVKKPVKQSNTPATAAVKNDSVKKESVVVEKKKEEEKKSKKGRKSIVMSEKFNCRAKDLFEILMDENRWKGFTQSNARISKEVGGEFSIFDGSVTGNNLELQEGKLIVQRWRFGSWNDGDQSQVCGFASHFDCDCDCVRGYNINRSISCCCYY
jgi:activator of HSP90 ATPase